MIDFIPCICEADAELDFDGGWRFVCHECGLSSKPVFTARAARKEFRLLLASLEQDDDDDG